MAGSLYEGYDFVPDFGWLTATVLPAPPPPPPPPGPKPADGRGFGRLAELHSIDRLYQAYFLRAPDRAGLGYWADAYFGCTMTLDGISAQFAGSSEFDQRYGNLSNRQFVELVYRNVLERTGEPSGITYWTGLLDSARATRGRVMTGFSESPEFVLRMGTTPPQSPLCIPRSVSNSVYRLYTAYFVRSPDVEGERYWVGSYGNCRASLGVISAAFAQSTEFQVQYGSLTNQEFTDRAYLNVLGRSGDAAGLSYWTSILDQGRMNRGQVMIGFSESSEYVELTGTTSPRAPSCLVQPAGVLRIPSGQLGFGHAAPN